MYSEVVAALEAVLGNDTAPKDRHDAEVFLQNVKDSVESMELIEPLLDVSNVAEVRHFGLHVMEHHVKYSFEDFSSSQREFSREFCLRLVVEGAKPTEEAYVKHKIAAVVFEVVVREWPHEWPNFLDALWERAAANITSLQLVVLVLGRLSESLAPSIYNIYTGMFQPLIHKDGVTTSRRTQLHQLVIKRYIRQIGDFLERTLHDLIESLSSDPGNDTTITVACEVVEVFSSAFTWAPLSFTLDTDIISRLNMLMRHESIKLRIAAGEAMLVLLNSRFITPPERPNLLQILDGLDVYVEAFAIQVDPTKEEDRDLHMLQRVVVAIVVDLAFLQVEVMDRSVHGECGRLFDLVVSALGHPSVSFGERATLFLSHFLKTGAVSSDAVSDEVFGSLLQACAENIYGLTYPVDEQPDTWQAYARLDFNDTDDAKVHKTRLRARYMNLFRSMSALNIEATFAFAREGMITTLGQLGEMDARAADVTFRAATSLFHICLQTVPSERWTQDDALIAGIDDILGRLLEFQCGTPKLLITHIKSFAAFLPFLFHHGDKLPSVVNAFFITWEEGSVEPLDVQMATCNAILALANHSRAACLVPLLSDMYERLTAIMARPGARMTCGLTVAKALITISALPKASQQSGAAWQEYFQNFSSALHLLTGRESLIAAQWSSDDFVATLSDVAQFMDTAGLLSLEDVHSPRAQAFRSLVGAALESITYTIHTAHKRRSFHLASMVGRSGSLGEECEHPLAEMLRVAIPGIIRLTRSLHAMWTNDARLHVPAPLQPALEEEDDVDEDDDDSVAIGKIRDWLESARNQCYDALGRAVSLAGDPTWVAKFVYTDLITGDALSQEILADVQWMQNRHIDAFFAFFFIPYITYFPQDDEMLGSLYIPAVSFVGQSILERLMEQWETYDRLKHEENPGNDLDEEIKFEHGIRSASVAFSAFIASLVPSMARPERAPSFVRLLENESFRSTVERGALESLRWDDSTTKSASAGTLKQLFSSHLSLDVAYLCSIAPEVLQVCIQAMADTTEASLHESLIEVVTDAYLLVLLASQSTQYNAVGAPALEEVRKAILSLPNIAQEDVLAMESRITGEDGGGQGRYFVFYSLLASSEVVGANTAISRDFQRPCTVLPAPGPNPNG